MIVAGSMLSETPGAWNPLSCHAKSHMACSLGQNGRQSTQTFPFSGLRVRFRAHTLHLANSCCKQQYRAAGSALPGKAEDSWIGHLFSFSIMAQSLVN